MRRTPLRRVSKRQAGVVRLRVALRDLALARDGRRCQARVVARCAPGLTAHHLQPSGWGGADFLENLITVCTGPGSCHAWIHAHESDAIERGLLRRRSP